MPTSHDKTPRRVAWRTLFRGFAGVTILTVIMLAIFVFGRQRVVTSARKQLAAAHTLKRTISPHNKVAEAIDRDLLSVLVLDGGGIRGLITLEILATLEEASGQRTAELFDVLTGTSTGGIIAVLLSLPGEDGRPRYSAKELVNFYRSFGTDVFSVPGFYSAFTLNGIVGPKFPRIGLREKIVNRIGDVHMADLVKPVWFPSYADTLGLPFYFRSRQVPSSEVPGSDEYYVADTLIAATTVPGIFMPVQVSSTDGKKVGLILDATTYAPNPVISAVMGASNLYPGKRMYMVSIGTGGSSSKNKVSQVSDWGLAQWLPHVLQMMAHADTAFESEFAIDDNMPDGMPICEHFYRIDKPFEGSWSSWFDVSDANMDSLIAFGKDVATEHDSEIEQISRDLLNIRNGKVELVKKSKSEGEP